MSLAHVREWVFDLDNTLYPVATLYDAIGERMTDFIAAKLGLGRVEALGLRERYFHIHGATVCGLVREHGVDPREFLDYVHDVDYSVLAGDPDLAALIDALPGRKFVFTNGGGGHAQRALRRLGLDACIERVFDIEDAGFAAKPDPCAYERLTAACGIDPARAALVEDTLKNLEPAHAMGFRTVLVGPVHPEPRPAYVDLWARDLKVFLRALRR